MVKRDHRGNPLLLARRQHAPVMVELGQGEFALFRLDARPLQGEAIEGEAQLGQQSDVFAVAVIVVAGIARWLAVRGARHVLKHPIIVVDIAPFHLVRGSGGTPEERGGKSNLHPRLPLFPYTRRTRARFGNELS